MNLTVNDNSKIPLQWPKCEYREMIQQEQEAEEGLGASDNNN